MTSIDHGLRAIFAPTGRLRASINLGNPILARADVNGGRPQGISVDLARALADRLAVDLELVVVDAPAKSVRAVEDGRADIGFFATDPLRGVETAFTDAYILIEGSYLVHDRSPLRGNDEVDREGHIVVVGKGSAYDLFLTREIRNAQLYRAPTSPSVVDVFVEQKADVAAGVRQQLEADAKRLGGLRLLDGRFMVIRQAMGMRRDRGGAASSYLSAYVEEQKANGFVSEAMRRHGIEGASVAPASIA